MHRSAPHSTPQRRAARALALSACGVATLLVLVSHPLEIGRAYIRARLLVAGVELAESSTVIWQETWYDCGPAALANLARVLGSPAPDLMTLRRLAGTTAHGTGATQLVAVASRIGIDLEYQYPTLDQLGPAVGIAWIERSHFVVVISHPDRALEIIDPLVGRYHVARETLRSRWSGLMLVAASSDSGMVAARRSHGPPVVGPSHP